MIDYGTRLRAAIAARSIPLKTFALRAQITEATLHRYLNGERTPTLEVAQRIAEALGLRVDALAPIR